VSTDDDMAGVVTDLVAATELIHAVAREVRSTAPKLEAVDFYTQGGTLDELPASLAPITAQTGNYSDGRMLREDSDPRDPAVRCAEAADRLHRVSRHPQAANQEVRRFHAGIGHIGVQGPC